MMMKLKKITFLLKIDDHYYCRRAAVPSSAVAHDTEIDAGGVRLQGRADSSADRRGGHSPTETKGRNSYKAIVKNTIYLLYYPFSSSEPA